MIEDVGEVLDDDVDLLLHKNFLKFYKWLDTINIMSYRHHLILVTFFNQSNMGKIRL